MKPKLSTKGKFGLLPSLIISIPLFLVTIAAGILIFILAKIFDAVGILDALDYQYKLFKRQVNKRRMI
jgi:hypothetical protein|tara:strand:- start:5565 stop:5768 length:204 start_codon:yes stop_codon:yes gene_type:complete